MINYSQSINLACYDCALTDPLSFIDNPSVFLITWDIFWCSEFVFEHAGKNYLEQWLASIQNFDA